MGETLPVGHSLGVFKVCRVVVRISLFKRRGAFDTRKLGGLPCPVFAERRLGVTESEPRNSRKAAVGLLAQGAARPRMLRTVGRLSPGTNPFSPTSGNRDFTISPNIDMGMRL